MLMGGEEEKKGAVANSPGTSPKTQCPCGGVGWRIDMRHSENTSPQLAGPVFFFFVQVRQWTMSGDCGQGLVNDSHRKNREDSLVVCM